MKKSLLTLALVAIVFGANAQDEATFNFFDPADCDADGWLWLDSQEKIDKYVGGLTSGKKVLLVEAQYETDDPDFPGETFTPQSYADASVQGYNEEGIAGGEGSVTGGIVLPAADWEYSWFPAEGGGILVPMPDCAQFDLYLSSPSANIYTAIYGASLETTDPTACEYIWDDGYDWATDSDNPISTNHVAWDYDIQKYVSAVYDDLTIYGEKGCGGRTALFYNYIDGEPMYVQGIRIFTYTNVNGDAGVEGIAADDLNVSVKGGVISVSVPVEISVYSPTGVKVASAYGTSLDCSSLKGIYLVKAGSKTVKVAL